jgi:hypothetical protein
MTVKESFQTLLNNYTPREEHNINLEVMVTSSELGTSKDGPE